jgi:hypothetical protein
MDGHRRTLFQKWGDLQVSSTGASRFKFANPEICSIWCHGNPNLLKHKGTKISRYEGVRATALLFLRSYESALAPEKTVKSSSSFLNGQKAISSVTSSEDSHKER